MKKLIHQVRQKPYKTREAVMWASSFVVFGLFLALWTVDFQSSTLALLNPEQEVQKDTAVAEEKKSASPFAAILTALDGVKDKITGAFSSEDNNVVEETREPVTLPLSK